jgi:hypothetical protein
VLNKKPRNGFKLRKEVFMNVKKCLLVVVLVFVVGVFVFADNSRVPAGYYLYTGTRSDVDYMIYVGDFSDGLAPFDMPKRNSGRTTYNYVVKIFDNRLEVFPKSQQGSSASRGHFSIPIIGRGELSYNGNRFRHQDG